MSLLQESMEVFSMMDMTTVPDGYGGFHRRWSPGAKIAATAVVDSSMEARTAEIMGVTALYTIFTSKGINLQYHDVLRRESDSKIFRVTSDGDDKKTPASATLDIRTVTAEEWELPNE